MDDDTAEKLDGHEQRPDVSITARWKGRGFRATITAVTGEKVVLCDTLDISSDDSRSKFVAKIAEALPGVDAGEVKKQMLLLVRERSKQLEAADQDESDPKQTISEMLVEIANDAELAHDQNGAGYARIEADGHTETWPVRSLGFRQWLARRLYEQYGKAAYTEATKTALDLIEAKAAHEGHKVEVFLRVGERDGMIYVDLCDDRWRVVEVTCSGWRVLDQSPVWFRRGRGMLPLPVPVEGGNVNELRPFLNVKDDADFVLVVAWLLAALNPHGPYPALSITGEQGSAKSTMQRLLRSLVDPNAAPLRNEPREPRDLIISASNSWALVFDNLSNIPPWLSDAFCRLATGGGSAFRAMYTNDEEAIFDATRPLAFNGISDLASRADLLDRCISITLKAIPAAERKDEKGLWADFEKARPRILGALLTTVAAGLKCRDQVHIDPSDRPRMLDFAQWAVACERGLPWKPGTFIAAYAGNRKDANAVAIESSAVGPVVASFMENQNEWHGSFKDLLVGLEGIVDDKTRQRKEWPATPPKLRHAIDRIAPNLRAAGIDVQMLPRTGQSRPIMIRRTASSCEPAAETRQTRQLLPTGPGAPNSLESRPQTSKGEPVVVGA